jgi:GT2 family glycosyltransferase
MFVSILIPCYNAEPWIAKAIESGLAQTWASKEVIVVDDGSTDGSLDEIQKFDGQIRWETGPNQGGNRARNRLTELAQGEWLQYLDADDYLLPDKIANQLVELGSNPDADVIFSPVTMEYMDGSECRREVSSIPLPHDPWVLLARWYLRQTGGALWRKDALLAVGGWKEDQPCCQEHELYLRLMMAGKRFVYSADEGAIYRQLQGSVSTRDISEVHRQRLQIEAQAEDFLRRTTQLTADRLKAINDARFEIARAVGVYDTSFASEIAETIVDSQPDFKPDGHSAPLTYKVAYRALGFGAAERLAQLKRKLTL